MKIYVLGSNSFVKEMVAVTDELCRLLDSLVIAQQKIVTGAYWLLFSESGRYRRETTA